MLVSISKEVASRLKFLLGAVGEDKGGYRSALRYISRGQGYYAATNGIRLHCLPIADDDPELPDMFRPEGVKASGGPMEIQTVPQGDSTRFPDFTTILPDPKNATNILTIQVKQFKAILDTLDPDSGLTLVQYHDPEAERPSPLEFFGHLKNRAGVGYGLIMPMIGAEVGEWALKGSSRQKSLMLDEFRPHRQTMGRDKESES